MPPASINPQINVFGQDGAPSLPLLHQELVECDQECLQARPWLMLHRACGREGVSPKYLDKRGTRCTWEPEAVTTKEPSRTQHLQLQHW